MNEERILDPEELDSEVADLDLSLRPKKFSDFVGQETTRKQLGIYVQAAKERNEALDSF